MSHSIPAVRALDEGDLPALLSLYEQLDVAEETPRERFAETWRHILRRDWIVHLGVFVEGELASTCHAVIVPNLSHGARPYAVIEGVITDVRHRRRGLGALAMRALIERCWEAGCYKVSLTSSLRRVEAHAFYEALGFETTKRAFVLRR